MSSKKRTAVVLAGGAARGAYEVGVVRYVLERVAKALRTDVRFDILCGTSVGALNACALAAFADLPPVPRVEKIVDIWRALEIDALVKPDVRGILGMGSPLLGRAVAATEREGRHGGLLDTRGLESFIAKSVPFERIAANVDAGYLDALTVSTTRVLTGRTIVFVDCKNGKLPPWSLDPTIEPRAAHIGLQHALASAAIPILFPAVEIDGEYHADGGLRQNVPLSPARRLGADAVLVINPRYVPPPSADVAASPKHPDPAPGPLFLLGKTLNALLLDRIDTDLARLESVNRFLEAGTKAYGPDFTKNLNRALGHEGSRGLKPMSTALVRASQDIGKLAARFVQSGATSNIGGITGRLIRRLAENDAENEADLLSYLLFDGRFAAELITLGFEDARTHHDDLCALFDPVARAQKDDA